MLKYGESVFVAAAILAFVVFTGVMFLDAFAESGPNCPDMDPAWLGYCERP